MVRPAWSVMSVKSTETAKSETAHAHPLELSAGEFRHVRAAARARGAPHAAYDGFVPRDRRQLRVSTRPEEWTIMPADAVSFWLSHSASSTATLRSTCRLRQSLVVISPRTLPKGQLLVTRNLERV
jgi:hypothetical protein